MKVIGQIEQQPTRLRREMIQVQTQKSFGELKTPLQRGLRTF